ncbi:MAG: SGNH/GDSL hydrolase family protein, partial [Kineosporiaceae bacterium]
MAKRAGGARWWVAPLSGLVGALVATVVVVTVGGRPAVVHATAATASPAATASAQPVHTVTFIGDSWTEGIGATGLRGYAVLTGEQLGWDYRVMGVGGSGYSVSGFGATFDERVDRAVATHPDVIVVQGTLNERLTPIPTLSAATETTLAHLSRVADPKTRILVVGSAYNPGTPNATIDSINGVIRTVAERHHLAFVDPAAEGWIDATNPSLWSNPDHPDDAGYQ